MVTSPTARFLRLLSCIAVAVELLLLQSCATITPGIESTYIVKERVRLGFRTVIIRELEGNWSAFDTTSYTPVYIFQVLDEKGTMTHEWLGGYHCTSAKPEAHPVAFAGLLSARDTLRSGRRWQYRADREVQASNARVRFWSVDSVTSGTLKEVFTTGYTRDEGIDARRERKDPRVMDEVREEATRYLYYELKRYVIQRVATL